MANDSTDKLNQHLLKELQNITEAGENLAKAAGRVTREYDGIHRLRLALAGWYRTRADEGGRPHGQESKQPASLWHDVNIVPPPLGRDRNGRMQNVLLVGQHPSGYWTDIYYSWWGGEEWRRWPHSFPPTHWQPAVFPPTHWQPAV